MPGLAPCALASFERDELRRLVVESASFKRFLDLAPRWRELVADYYGSRYAAALATLDALQPELVLDPHLHAHVGALTRAIRDRCLVQYCVPYLSVKLSSMADAFGMTLEQIEQAVAELISRQQVAALIDSHNKTLHMRQVDQRAATYKKVLATGRDSVREMRTMLLRMSCLEHDFQVRSGRGGGFSSGLLGDAHPLGFMNQQDSGDVPAPVMHARHHVVRS